MIGKKITNPETIKKNEEYTKSICEKAGAKSLESGVSKEDVKVGDVLFFKNEIRTVKEEDIKINFGFLEIFGSSFPTVKRFKF